MIETWTVCHFQLGTSKSVTENCLVHVIYFLFVYFYHQLASHLYKVETKLYEKMKTWVNNGTVIETLLFVKQLSLKCHCFFSAFSLWFISCVMSSFFEMLFCRSLGTCIYFDLFWQSTLGNIKKFMSNTSKIYPNYLIKETGLNLLLLLSTAIIVLCITQAYYPVQQ